MQLRRFDLRMKEFSLGYGSMFLRLFEIHMNVQDKQVLYVNRSVKQTKLIRMITALKRRILYKVDSCLEGLNRNGVGSKPNCVFTVGALC
jgi:hypothetical protein